MTTKKPRGYFEKLLVMDCETSGLAMLCDDATYNPQTGDVYQSVAWGFIVVNAQTLQPIEKLYVEIKWDGVSKWDMSAQKVHGLTLEYLEENGVDSEEAVVQIADLILRHWGPDSTICTAGHNVVSFDLWFLKRLMRSHGIELKFGNRHVCTNALGTTVWNTYNSDDLFDLVGYPTRDPENHNALNDAEAVLLTLQVTRRLWEKFVVPQI